MSSRSLNTVLLIGNLTRDPELRYTPQGTAVCSFGVATNRSWVDSSGQKQEGTEFHRIVAWQKLAELCSQLLFKGRKVFTEGRLQTRRWTGQDGQERVTTEIVINNMIILDSKRRPGEEERGESVRVAGSTVVKTKIPDDSEQTPDNNTQGGSEVKEEEKDREVKKEEKKEEEKKPAKIKDQPSAEKTKTKIVEEKEEVKADDIPF